MALNGMISGDKKNYRGTWDFHHHASVLNASTGSLCNLCLVWMEMHMLLQFTLLNRMYSTDCIYVVILIHSDKSLSFHLENFSRILSCHQLWSSMLHLLLQQQQRSAVGCVLSLHSAGKQCLWHSPTRSNVVGLSGVCWGHVLVPCLQIQWPGNFAWR